MSDSNTATDSLDLTGSKVITRHEMLWGSFRETLRMFPLEAVLAHGSPRRRSPHPATASVPGCCRLPVGNAGRNENMVEVVAGGPLSLRAPLNPISGGALGGPQNKCRGVGSLLADQEAGSPVFGRPR